MASRPLASHPELEVITTPAGDAVREYRVHNFCTLPSGRTVRGHSVGVSTSLIPVVVYASIGLHWGAVYSEWIVRESIGEWLVVHWKEMLLVLSALYCLWRLTRTVLYQSLTPLPRLGIQLSTTRGLSLGLTTIPLSTSRSFIPIADMSTVIINEGLRRWSVRYYLAILLREGRGVRVAYDIVTPRHAVLEEVYHGAREALYDEFKD